jgi:N4-gp56 family major capsid protein
MITIGTVTNVNSFYDKLMLVRLLPNLVHGLFAQVRDVPMNRTDVIKFRRYNSLTVITTALTEGVTPASATLTITDVSATLAQYGNVVEQSDVVVETTEDPYLDEIGKLIAENAGQSLDSILREILSAGTSVQYASTAASRGAVTAAMTLDLAEVREAVRTMKGNNVKKITQMQTANGNVDTIPGNACYVAIVHPNTTFDLKSDPDFVPIENYPSQGMVMPGEVGRMDEIRFIESTFAEVFDGEGAAGVDVYATLVIGADAYGVSRISTKELEMIHMPLGSAGAADPLKQRSTFSWKSWFTGKILQQLAILRIEHGSSIDA